MATPSRSSTASARLRNKTSELSDLFRGRQHSSLPSSSSAPDPSPKAKRKIPLFSLRRKSPAAPDVHHSPIPPVPTPSSSTNPASPVASTPRQAQPPQLTIPRSSFSPLSTFDDASSKRSSTSPTNTRSTRSVTRTSSSNTPSTVSKSRTPTPTSAVTLGGGSFSDSEPPRSNVRTPTTHLRSYASDDEERRYLSARNIPPSKPAPTKSLPPPPENASFSTAYPTPTTPNTPSISFPSPASSYTPLSPDTKLPPSSVRKFAVSTSTARSTSFRLTSGSESASESAQGYTSASGSESTTGLGLGFRIRTRSGQGNDNGLTSRAALRVGVLRAPNALVGSKATSPPSPKSQYPPVSLARTSPPASRTSLERTGSSLSTQPSHSSSLKRASPPIQGTTSKHPSDVPPRRQTEPTTAPSPSSTKHASWLVIPKPVHTSASSSGPTGGQEVKVTAPSKLRARAASDSRTFSAANSASSVSSNLQASTTPGASAQPITATQALSATSPPNLLKSPSTVVVPTSSQTNRVESRTNSPPPTEPLPSPPRPNLPRTSSDTSRQASAPSSGSPSSSGSSTRTLTKPSALPSTSNLVSASGSGTVGSSGTDSSNTLSSPSGSATPSTVRSLPAVLPTNGSARRPSAKDERTAGKDKSKDSTWPARSTSKRSSPPGASLLLQSHTSSESPPYASPSSFSASTTAPTAPSISTSPPPQPPPSRVIVPIPPTPANLFALQTENGDLRAEIVSLREQLENADRLARRREREIRGLRWLLINWGGDKKDTLGLTVTTERRPSGDATESQEEVQAAVRYLRAESESGYGSGSASGSHSRMSHSSAYSSVYPAESVSEGSGSEIAIAQRFGPGPRARASEDHALDAIPERIVVGSEDTAAAEAERRRKRDERRASRALKRLSASGMSDSTGSGLDEVVSQGMLTNNSTHGRTMSIEQVMEGDRARRERIGLKGMDEVLDKLRAVAGVDPGAGAGAKK